MTAKRVTLGVKPMLVNRDTARAGSGEPMPTVSEAGPSSASAASIEDWLRNGETSADEKAPAVAETPAEVGREESEASEPASTEVVSAVPAPVASRKSGSSDLPPWVGIVSGAVAGALVAAAAVVLLPRFMPAMDARLAPLAERVTTVETALRGVDGRIGKLNNEMAQSLDDQGTAVTKLDEQAAEIEALKQAAAAEVQRVDPAAGIDSPVFSVALGQLRTTFYSGRPFEAELMNVYALAGNSELFSGYLTELMGPARTGVANAAELYRVFPSYVAAAGLQIGSPEGYYQYGMSLVNRYVVATESYRLEAANLAVTRAARLLAAGDVGGAVPLLQEMDARYVAVMMPWLDAAKNYLRNETAITEMTRIVVDRLRDKIAKEMPAADLPEPSAMPAAVPEAPVDPAAPAEGSIDGSAPPGSTP